MLKITNKKGFKLYLNFKALKLIEEIVNKNNIWKIINLNNKKNDKNFDELFLDYKKIYEKRFRVKYDKSFFNKELKNSLLYLCFKNNKPEGIMRYKILTGNDKYLKLFKLKKAIFLSDLASKTSGKGIGSYLLNFLFKQAKKENLLIITVPWNNKAQKFYEKFNFKSYSIKNKKYPSIIQIYRKKISLKL